MFALPRLLGVATAVPPFVLDQSDVVERVKLLFGRSPDLDRLLPVFLNTGILRRYSCVPIEWYDRGGHPNPHLSDKIKKLGLTPQEKQDLVAYMQALTGDFPKVETGRLPQ